MESPYIPCRTPPRWFSDRKDRSKAAFPVRPLAPGGHTIGVQGH
jgi:hypothetical protein